MGDGIARRVWVFSDGSKIEFETATKQIKNFGAGLCVEAIIRIRDAMPDMMKAARGQTELDGLIISGLDMLIK